MASAAEQLAANINWSAFSKAEELKKRIWFTLGALVIFRLGTYIPLPGIDPNAFEQSFLGQKQGVLDMFNMFSGGAVQRMAVFALNIMPYISASIIIQLLSSVLPSLEAIKKEGESGRKILNQYTRYLTVVLALFQAYGIAIGLEGRGGVVAEGGFIFRFSTMITLTGGTMFLVWLGEQITSRGVGNGSSPKSKPSSSSHAAAISSAFLAELGAALPPKASDFALKASATSLPASPWPSSAIASSLGAGLNVHTCDSSCGVRDLRGLWESDRAATAPQARRHGRPKRLRAGLPLPLPVLRR